MAIKPLKEQQIPETGFIFKHSTRCPISAAAAEAVKGAAEAMEVHWVNVIEQRPLSDWLADRLTIPHESPQLIELKGGRVLGVWSHFEISRKLSGPA